MSRIKNGLKGFAGVATLGISSVLGWNGGKYLGNSEIGRYANKPVHYVGDKTNLPGRGYFLPLIGSAIGAGLGLGASRKLFG